MALILYYSLRNLLARRLTTFLTAVGMALVVFVFAAIIMLAEGLEQTLVDTGSWDNAFVLRKGSESEVQSTIERGQSAIIETWPEVALAQDGAPLAARELVVLMVLEKRGGGSSNVPIRGMDRGLADASLTLRPGIRLVAGRLPRPGTAEIMVGAKVVKGFRDAELGGSIGFAQRRWHIVGVFDAGRTAFSSEIWGDAEQLMQAFRRQAYPIVVFRLRDPAALQAVKDRAAADRGRGGFPGSARANAARSRPPPRRSAPPAACRTDRRNAALRSAQTPGTAAPGAAPPPGHAAGLLRAGPAGLADRAARSCSKNSNSAARPPRGR